MQFSVKVNKIVIIGEGTEYNIILNIDIFDWYWLLNDVIHNCLLIFTGNVMYNNSWNILN